MRFKTAIDWWHSLDGTTRYKLMKKYSIESVSNKSINRIYRFEKQ